MRGAGGVVTKSTWRPSHLQQVFDVCLFTRALNAEQRPSVHLAGLTSLAKGNTTRHVMEIRDLIAGLLWTPQTHGLT